MNAKAVAYIQDTLLSQLNHLFTPIPGIIAGIDENDPHTVNVFYPAAFEAAYIRPAVRLEIGPLASWVPSSTHGIKAYAAQAFPEAFSNPVFEVIAIDAERTFWERQRSSIRKLIVLAQFLRGTRGTTTTSTS
jgi:hypothetical protein